MARISIESLRFLKIQKEATQGLKLKNNGKLPILHPNNKIPKVEETFQIYYFPTFSKVITLKILTFEY